MIIETVERRILQILSQTYALSLDEVVKLYCEIHSFDKIIDILKIIKENPTRMLSLNEAHSIWKERNV